MNLTLLAQTLRTLAKDTYAQHYRLNEITESEMTARVSRIRRTQERVREHGLHMERSMGRQHRLAEFHKKVNEAATGIAKGSRFMCFDLEGGEDFHEVGIATYQLGVRDTLNLRVEGRHTNTRSFEHGSSTTLPLAAIMEILRAEIATADFLVGHSLKYDFANLKANGFVFPKKPFHDTAWWSQWLTGHDMASLVAMCERYGIEASTCHVAGNDAHNNISLFLAMAEKHAEV